jgi:hypothetical protein
MQKLKAKAASTATDLEVVLKEQLSSLLLGPGVTVAKPTGTQNVVTTAAIAVSTDATVTNQPEFKSVQPVAVSLSTSVPNSMSARLMALLNLSKSRIRQLITLEEMPTDPDEAKLWYDANAKKNPLYKRGPAKHQEMLLAGACVEGFCCRCLLRFRQHGHSPTCFGRNFCCSCRAAQNSRNAESVDDALLWRQNRITQSNHTAGARTKANPAPVLFANQLQVKFDQRNAVILVASDWRDKLHARILRLLAKDAKVAMKAAVSGSLHLVARCVSVT